jgi:hypothetical protein
MDSNDQDGTTTMGAFKEALEAGGFTVNIIEQGSVTTRPLEQV